MYRLSRTILLCVLVVGFLAQGAWAKAAPRTAKDLVLEADATYRAARKADDVAKMQSMMAPDFIAVDHLGNQMNRAQFLAWVGHRKAHFRTWENPPSEWQVHITGNTAIVSAMSSVSGEFEMRGKLETLNLTARSLRTWVSTPQGWKLAAVQWMVVKK